MVMKLNRRQMPDIATLQAFECAARHGGFTQAARELNLTQSAVSRQIKELEARLGLTLFERVRQRVVLSEQGHALLPEVRNLLNRTEAMVLKAMASRAGQQSLSIATLPTFASRWLTPRLPGFLEGHPGTTLELASRSEPFDFDEENFDLAIHYGQPVWAKAVCHYLCREVILPVACPALKERMAGLGPADLADGPLLHLSARPKLWAEWFDEQGLDTAGAFSGHRFGQFSMQIEAAIAGLGAALLPRYLIEQELADGRLAILFERPLTTENSYYVVVPEGKRENPLAEAFRLWISSQVTE
jgi:LysR family transcriptional regulator, glycine cleavage system transcriptional activator